MAAQARGEEILFGSFFAPIDNHESAPNYATLPIEQAKQAEQAEAFESFYNDLVKVAALHFDA